mmetsp:Transcript_21265/g.64842  ORF Transcript_21265/g.64842 Transcript_21265/m.64842 type:complete len:237 (+) Transcript_21265:207-917(+)
MRRRSATIASRPTARRRRLSLSTSTTRGADLSRRSVPRTRSPTRAGSPCWARRRRTCACSAGCSGVRGSGSLRAHRSVRATRRCLGYFVKTMRCPRMRYLSPNRSRTCAGVPSPSGATSSAPLYSLVRTCCLLATPMRCEACSVPFRSCPPLTSAVWDYPTPCHSSTNSSRRAASAHHAPHPTRLAAPLCHRSRVTSSAMSPPNSHASIGTPAARSAKPSSRPPGIAALPTSANCS